MNETASSASWRTFVRIVGMAAAVAAVYWLAAAAFGSALVAVLVAVGLVMAYGVGAYREIRLGSFRRAVQAHFAVLSVVALCAMWWLGAIVALVVLGGPIGPDN